MKVDKHLLPWLLIIGSVVIASITYHRQERLNHINATTNAVVKPSPIVVEKPTASDLSPKPVTVTTTHYQCDQYKVIEVMHADNNPDSAKITLSLDGQRYELYSVPSQAGSVYVSRNGVQSGEGMRWHVQGLEARLFKMSPALTVKPDNAKDTKEQPLLRCQEPV